MGAYFARNKLRYVLCIISREQNPNIEGTLNFSKFEPNIIKRIYVPINSENLILM